MIVITWMGLTQYGARCVGAFVEQCHEEVKVVQLPARRFSQGNLDQLTHCEIIDVQADDLRPIEEVAGKVPDIFLLAGWSAPAMVRWARQVKASGGHVIMGTDEAFVDRSWRQFVRKWRFLLKFNPWIDRMFVCGQGGIKQFVDYYGLPPTKVFTGCYASDPTIFFNGPDLRQRAKRLIYVGKFDTNKNIVPLCRAFARVHARHSDWEFEICGNGPLTSEIGEVAGVADWDGKTPVCANGFVLTGFVDNAKLGDKYRSSRCFILGSFSEKWGVVVHEAAACGCLLLLSNRVGAHFDFACEANSALFTPSSFDEMERAMEKIVSITDRQLVAAQESSVRLASKFSPKVYARNLKSAIDELRASR